MYQIVTRTGRTVQTEIVNLNTAINRLKLLEFDLKRARIYNPGYYRIEKSDDKPTLRSE